METKVFYAISRCILCCRKDKSNIGLLDINTKKMPNSNKTIKSVLIHLSKCIQKDFNFDFNSFICSFCYEKLAKYDQIMMKLLVCQTQLGNMLKESMKIFEEHKIKDECVENRGDYKFEIKPPEEIQGHELVTEVVDNEFGSLIKDEVASICSTNSNEDKLGNFDEPIQDSKYHCTICDKHFRKKNAFENHRKTHATFKCNICGETRRDEEYLELHMNVHEGKSENECRYCPKQYTRRSHVIRHMHLHWDKQKFQCEKCGLRFSQANILYNHKMNHEAEEQPLICNVCCQKFKSKRTFNHHMITHQEDRPMYPCNICGKVFSQKYTIKAHLRTHSEGNETFVNSNKKIKVSKKSSKEFPCIICDKVLGTKDLLDTHMAKEHDVIYEEA